MTTRSIKGNKAYRSYLKSEFYDLRDAYDSWSWKKQEAWDYCKKLCNDIGGHHLKIIGKNTYHFSAGFLFEANDKEYLMFITHAGEYPIEIKED